ncbi:hypothetical protein NRS6186_15490 [Bacillus subtilis]|nr:hypothetical protein NRS6099_00264 [Bacillus subtilis]CAF1719595.1 hypothetical protein NRS6103_00314 [Bacillus subtilis]CAF1799033.1 hypothetical protein NRS6127_00918 [Bacillus subtilis]CAF1799997.1 hypothetical protein NRS6132_01001 [Bacillus subtilis]CAF1863796.1 hypothetical protein NRS6181_02688 [Bacillus subtilis]
MNVSAFKVTILYMFVHVNDIFYLIYICAYVFTNIKTRTFKVRGFLYECIFNCLNSSVNNGTTSNKSPTMP